MSPTAKLAAGAAVLATLAIPSPSWAGPRRAPPPPPPGGYYGVGEVPEIPPRDGERALLTGSILLPLGALRLATGFLQVELASPERCTYTASSCAGLTTYGYIGMSSGALMLVTGATFLGIGLVRRGRYRRWKAERNLAWRHDFRWQLSPMVSRRGASVGLNMRF